MRVTDVERCSSISFASLRASSTGWTFVRKARPKTPSKSALHLLLDSPQHHGCAEDVPPGARGTKRCAAADDRADAASEQAAATSGSRARRRRRASRRASRAPSPAAPQRPRARAWGRASATSASAPVSSRSDGCAPGRAGERAGDVERVARAGDAESERRTAHRREAARRAGSRRRARRRARRLRPASARSGAERVRDRGERERGRARRSARAAARARRGARRAAPARSRASQPAAKRRVEEREPERDVAEREHRHGERERDADRARADRVAAHATSASTTGQPCGKNGSAAAVQPARSAARTAVSAVRPRSRVGSRNPAPRGDGRRDAAPRSASASSRGRRPPGRVGRERAVDEPQQRLRQVGAERRRAVAAPASIARAVSSIEPRQNGCRPASASQSITPTAQTSAAGVASLAGEPLGRDVRERSRHVSLRSVSVSASAICASPKSSTRAETCVAVGEEDVRRLDVAMEDPGRMCVRKAVADLRAGLDRVVVGQLPGAQRLAVRLARDELVRDVDVPRVAARTRTRAGRRDGAGAPPPWPRARPARPTCPPARRSSARRRGPSARRGQARPSPSRRCRAAASGR